MIRSTSSRFGRIIQRPEEEQKKDPFYIDIDYWNKKEIKGIRHRFYQSHTFTIEYKNEEQLFTVRDLVKKASNDLYLKKG